MSIVSQVELQQVLDNHLKTVVGLPPFVRESEILNLKTLPNSGANFVRSTLLPARTQQISLGLKGWNMLSGLYQIDVFSRFPYAYDNAVNPSLAVVDAIMATFTRGTNLVGSNFRIEIVNPSRVVGRIVDETKYWMTPIQVEYFIFEQPNI